MDGRTEADPLISCLMINWGRPTRLKSAVSHYLRQTWRNKELVVVLGEGERETELYLGDLNRPDIRTYRSTGLPTIPRLRNMAIDHAMGDILCQWDDDDLYHPLRLERQVGHLLSEGADACMFGDHLHYFEESNDLYWADWGRPFQAGHPGTLMCRRSLGIRYREDYLVASDAALEEELRQRAKITYFRGQGYLYAYVFHGKNVWDLAHHRKIAETLSFDREWLMSHLGELERHLEAFPELPRAVCCGSGEKLAIGLPI